MCGVSPHMSIKENNHLLKRGYLSLAGCADDLPCHYYPAANNPPSSSRPVMAYYGSCIAAAHLRAQGGCFSGEMRYLKHTSSLGNGALGNAILPLSSGALSVRPRSCALRSQQRTVVERRNKSALQYYDAMMSIRSI